MYRRKFMLAEAGVPVDTRGKGFHPNVQPEPAPNPNGGMPLVPGDPPPMPPGTTMPTPGTPPTSGMPLVPGQPPNHLGGPMPVQNHLGGGSYQPPQFAETEPFGMGGGFNPFRRRFNVPPYVGV